MRVTVIWVHGLLPYGHVAHERSGHYLRDIQFVVFMSSMFGNCLLLTAPDFDTNVDGVGAGPLEFMGF